MNYWCSVISTKMSRKHVSGGIIGIEIVIAREMDVLKLIITKE